MVQTRLAKRKIEDPDGVASTSLTPSVPQTLESLDEEDPVPPKKRPRQTRKTAKKVVVSRRRQGRKELCQLNLDVLHLIAEYIHPLDLLNLSRTCKSLRTLLMDKSSTFVWKTARGQVEYLPDCPSDLTEPEYANLVFCARCHGCGKYAQIIFWKMRRRYCPGCRLERFIPYGACDEVIRNDYVMAYESFALEKEPGIWYDKEQVNSFMEEYKRSSDKSKFLNEKTEQCRAIKQHANKCENYQRIRNQERRSTLNERRHDRERQILERLKQCGYDAEVTYHGLYTIKECYPSAFKTSKPLKDKEWGSMLPQWIEKMDNFKERRLDKTVYQPRRQVLANEYKRLLENPPDSLKPSYVIPHVADLANLPAFRSITRAPEETPHDSYVTAFAQLPNIVEEWMQQVMTELRELVDIPSDSRLSEITAMGQAGSSNSASASPKDVDKLQLACALFRVDAGASAYTYMDALTRCMCYKEYPSYAQTESEPATGPITGQLRITFINEAPYIVHACGLDPSATTAADMDRRNARLACLRCNAHMVMPWRTAIYHAACYHRATTPSRDLWQLVGDEHIEAIQALEKPSAVLSDYQLTYCLLCRRHVGGALNFCLLSNHLVIRHEIEPEEIQVGVHYAPLDIRFADGVYTPDAVTMGEEEGKLTFKTKEHATQTWR